jgi:cobalt transporter subunit CbtA
MLNRVFSVALLAGLTAGLIVSALQHFTTTPLILRAEVYEKAAAAADGEPASAASVAGARVVSTQATEDAGSGPAHGEHDIAEWSPENGIARTAYTSLATIATAVGFALILLAGMIAAGDQIDGRRAVGWGAAAFLAAGVAPAMGLAPELPGSAAGDLAARQLWWLGTAAATAIALWLVLRTSAPWAMLGGVLLLLAPHIVGAPHAEALASRVPAELAAKFAANSLAVQATLWLTVAYFAGFFWSRYSRKAAVT